MATVLILLTVLIAILLILLVLVQPGKADMGATFGGGLGSQMGNMFGTERSKNILATATRACAVAILILILVTNKFFVGGNQEVQNKIITEGQAASSMRTTAPQAKMPGQAQEGQQQMEQKQAQPAEQPKK